MEISWLKFVIVFSQIQLASVPFLLVDWHISLKIYKSWISHLRFNFIMKVILKVNNHFEKIKIIEDKIYFFIKSLSHLKLVLLRNCNQNLAHFIFAIMFLISIFNCNLRS